MSDKPKTDIVLSSATASSLAAVYSPQQEIIVKAQVKVQTRRMNELSVLWTELDNELHLGLIEAPKAAQESPAAMRQWRETEVRARWQLLHGTAQARKAKAASAE